MAKQIRKMRPGNYWQLPEHESWLQDMAANGLHLQKLTNAFGYFEQGERMEKAYKIELTKKMSLSADQLEKSEQLGRNYVTKYTSAFLTYHVFSMPITQQRTQLVVEEEEYDTALASLKNRLVWNSILGILGFLVILGLMLALLLSTGTPVYVLVTGAGFSIVIVLVNSVSLLFNVVSSIMGIRTFKEGRLERHDESGRVDWERGYRLQKILSILLMVFMLLLACIPIFQLWKMDTKSLPSDGQELPITRLADFEENMNLINDAGAIYDDVNWSSHYSSEWGPLAPIQYDTYEVLTDPQTGYRPNLITKTYQLRFKSLTEPFFNDLMKRQNEFLQQKDFTELEHPAFDQLLVYEDEQIMTIYAFKGKAVTEVMYHGEVELEPILESLEQRLSMIAN